MNQRESANMLSQRRVEPDASRAAKTFPGCADDSPLFGTPRWWLACYWHKRAKRRERRGEAREALAAYERAIKFDGCRASWFRDMATLYSDCKDEQGVRRALRRAVELQPDNESYLSRLATRLASTGESNEALQLLERAMHVRPAARPAFVLGRIYKSRNELDRALALFELAFELAGTRIESAWRHEHEMLLDEMSTRDRIEARIARNRAGEAREAVRVVFLIQNISTWYQYRTVYEACAADPDFEAMIVAIPQKCGTLHDYQGGEECYQYFRAQGIDVIRGHDPETNEFLDVRTLSPDLVFIQNPNCTLRRPPELHVDQIKRFARVGYVPYSVMITDNMQVHCNLPFHPKCWRIFVDADELKRNFAEYSPIGDRHVVVSGSPKLELHFRDDIAETEREKGERIWKMSRKERPDVRRIIWSPHWTITERGRIQFSQFPRYFKHFNKLIEENRDLEFVFRPHPNLLPMLTSTGFMTEQELESWRAWLNAQPNASHYDGPDYFALFLASDAMINDSVSFLVEYLPTRKPILFTVSPDYVGFNSYGQKIVEHYYRAHNEQDIDAFIRDVVRGGADPLYEQRMTTLRKQLYQPEGGAGRFIKEYIAREFGLR